jgi:glycerol-1-phosphatase
VTHAPDLLNAPVEHRPTYLAQDLAGLLDPQPDVDWDGSVARCGGWAASTAVATTISVDGEGRAIDGLRAVLTAAWMLPATEGSQVDASGALNQLGFG